MIKLPLTPAQFTLLAVALAAGLGELAAHPEVLGASATVAVIAVVAFLKALSKPLDK